MVTYKRLYRSREDRIVAGIFGGLGEYFDIDPVLLRLVFIVLFVVTGFVPGIVIYLLVIFIVPQTPSTYQAPGRDDDSSNPRVHNVDPVEPRGDARGEAEPEQNGDSDEIKGERPAPRTEPVSAGRREDPLW